MFLQEMQQELLVKTYLKAMKKEDGTYRTYDEMVAEEKPLKYDGKWTAPCTAPRC